MDGGDKQRQSLAFLSFVKAEGLSEPRKSGC